MTLRPPLIRQSELTVRIASSVVMIGVAVAAIGFGGWPFTLLTAAAALLIAAEWSGMMRAGTGRIALCVAGVGLVLGLRAFAGLEAEETLRYAFAAGLGVALLGLSARLGLGVLYAVLPVLALVHLRGQPDGLVLTFWTLAIVWATDIGAYFTGRRFGGPKLAPRLSPNKTCAGLIGGMVAALAMSAMCALTLGISWRLASLAPALAVAAQAGDLFESWLKRRAGVKDSGRLLPGHGGAMDRLDGVVPVACIVALLAGTSWA